MNNLSYQNAYLFLLPLFVIRTAVALPTGTESMQGNLSLDAVGKELQITAADGAILRHDSFDVAADEIVRFIQPGSYARVLNRISSPTPSRIDGQLLANGHVYLVNPAGIIFGETSTVEVGKLHAIAGVLADQDFLQGTDRYSAISGLIENKGQISAGEVVLAGTTLSNSGKILAPGGLVVLAAGTSLELASTENSVSVSLESPSPGSHEFGAGLTVGDLAGQALLQSGIVEASKLELHAPAIALVGKTSATEANVGKLHSLTQLGGSVETESLSLAGGSETSDAATVDLSSNFNRIAELRPSGTFDKLAVRNTGSMSLPGPAFNSQVVDLRVSQGGLTLANSISPHSEGSASSMLLAAEGSLQLGFDLRNLNFLQKIFYGSSLSSSFASPTYPQPGSYASLNRGSVGLDDLSSVPTPSLLRAIAGENPTFEDFLFNEYVAETSGTGSAPPDSHPSFVPVATTENIPGNSPGSPPGASPASGVVGTSGDALSLATMSDEQLGLIIDLGFFNEYSYLLEVVTSEETYLQELATSGGVSSLFGGSYATVASDSASSGSGKETGASDADLGGGDEEGESIEEAGEDGDQEGGSDSTSVALRAAAAVPFAPISMPILSPDANRLLDSALSNQVEAGLQRFLDAPAAGQAANGSLTSNAMVREVKGSVRLYDPGRNTFAPAAPGFVVDRPMLFVTAGDSSLVFSGSAGIAGQVSGNSRVVLAPAADGSYEANLRKGTVSVLLDPDRPSGGPGFSVRTAQGLTSAEGTFFAVTEYKGQTYGKVKKGTVKRKVTAPGQADFAAYLSKSKSKPKPASKN